METRQQPVKARVGVGMHRLHPGRAVHVGHGQDGTAAQRARAELHAALEPADGGLLDQRVDAALQQRVLVEELETRAGGVARGGLHPQPLEGAVAQDPAVGDAVQRHPAGQAEVRQAKLGREGAREAQHRFLDDGLDGRGQVLVALLDGRLRPARRAAEQLVETAVGHGQAGAVVEVT